MARDRPTGYTLILCEKPDAARRISYALAEGAVSTKSEAGVDVFTFQAGGKDFAVCAGQGHLYAISDPFGERTVYPVFDLEWFPKDMVGDKAPYAGRRVRAIRELAGRAGRFVNACDYDIEGETIGFNLLRYACGGKESDAARAKFSALTKEELVESFGALEEGHATWMAEAGRARHAIDFIWGVNLSRALSLSVKSTGSAYRTVSIGRVQGPTLNFLVDREREIRAFVPTPYWKLAATFDKVGRRFAATFSQERVGRKADAEKVVGDCHGAEALVQKVDKRTSGLRPPPAFNLGDLQKEAYRAFRYPPSRTLQIAQRLYLRAAISYPRTSSQKLPPAVGYEKIIRGLARAKGYEALAKDLLGGPLRPAQGWKDDPAHPAIHPTGEAPGRLDQSENRVYDLVVRRFLAAFGEPAVRATVSASIVVRGHTFRASGTSTVRSGWLRFYQPYSSLTSAEIPALAEGDRLRTVSVTAEEKFDQRPQRYNQSSLLEKMENEGIGTKATRAEVISTLLGRGYAVGEGLVASDLGFAVVEVMERHAPSILSTALTKRVEEGLEKVERGEGDGRDVVIEAVHEVAKQLTALRGSEATVGVELQAAARATQDARSDLGPCPVCRQGNLRVIRSKKTKKRFVGCSNYRDGCRASAPLPQRGVLKKTDKACKTCGWPVVLIVSGRRPWKLCVNVGCPTKVAKNEV